jgi:acyl-CoA synthetase (AMP-forming)/AMP-acid ligase II
MPLHELLSRGEAGRIAVVAPGRLPLTFMALRGQVERAQHVLVSAGVQPGDAVALICPNGPEALTATLGIASCASVAPLNPAYTAEELDFYLSDLAVRAVVLHPDAGKAGVVAARRGGVPAFVLTPQPAGPAGTFDLAANESLDRRGPARSELRSPDVALLLHTSGTTARPKLVPLTRGRLLRSASNIAAALGLTMDDVCLNVMPLFHVHGMIGAALSSLAAGAAVFCAPGFNALRFYAWLEQSRASWYTAVPTMHQAVVARGHARGARRLRLVRSCSSPLPESVAVKLESHFQVPVVNAYGMTEATHQIACSPLRPAGRKPGSVGLPTGPEVAVLGETGSLLPAGARGEIVLRGGTIIDGYEQPAGANAAAFANGWFRTGDEGVVDADGHISLTGRLKELINSGGEKISPYEVEDLLLRHPAVSQAVCFAIPHRTRGEAVGAAVVLRGDGQADERALRRFAADHLSAFKVPQTVVLLAQLPKGPTGKLMRIGMARALGLDAGD